MQTRCTETNERSGTQGLTGTGRNTRGFCRQRSRPEPVKSRDAGQLREMHGRTRVRVGNRVWGVRSRVPCSFRHRCLARFISPVSRCHAMYHKHPPSCPPGRRKCPQIFCGHFLCFVAQTVVITNQTQGKCRQNFCRHFLGSGTKDRISDKRANAQRTQDP